MDDDVAMLRTLSRVFGRSGWACERTASPLAALELLRRGVVDAIVADYCMQPFDGIELCRRARRAGFGGPLVIYSGYVTCNLRESAARASAWAIVPKDTNAQALAVQLGTLCDSCAHRHPAATPPTCRDPVAAARAYAREHRLSPRETEVLEHALCGEVRKQCAAGIGTAPGSVASYWQRIYRKTKKRDREEVVLDVLGFVLESVSHALEPRTDSDGDESYDAPEHEARRR